MATQKKPTDKTEPVTLNREQRRREKFGRAGKVHEHTPQGPWPEIEANPALLNATGEQAADTGAPDQDVTHKTAPGTGGATKTADRAPAREGQRPGTKPEG